MTQSSTTKNTDDVVVQVLKAIEALRFGSVEITIHDGRVTLIEKREKFRIGTPYQKTSDLS